MDIYTVRCHISRLIDTILLLIIINELIIIIITVLMGAFISILPNQFKAPQG